MKATTAYSPVAGAFLLWFASVAPAPVHAATAGGIYDMDALLRQPHPFTQPYAPAAAPAAPAYVPPAAPVYAAPSAPPPMPASPRSVAQAPAGAATRPIPAPPPGSARPAEPTAFLGIFSEVRGGVLAHDFGPFSHRKEDGVDVNAELLFASPGFMDLIWSPRPTVGGSFNASGDTSQAYLGLTWEWDFLEDGFFSFFWGGAVHNGEKNANVPDKKDLGCRVLFREGIDLGWRIADNHAVMIHFDHISNAKLCDQNEGLESLGLRYGYRF